MNWMNFLMSTGSTSGQQSPNMAMTIIMYVVLLGVFFYFMLWRPQKKEQKKAQELQNSIQAGDSITTTSGFYGVVLDVVDDTVIVEFGNNKNCRIPMMKSAIAAVEKADAGVEE